MLMPHTGIKAEFWFFSSISCHFQSFVLEWVTSQSRSRNYVTGCLRLPVLIMIFCFRR